MKKNEKKFIIIVLLILLGGLLLSTAINKNTDNKKKQLIPTVETVDQKFYYQNVYELHDSIILSRVSYNGAVGDFRDEKILQKWYCPDSIIRGKIALSTIDFHQQPGELKMLHLAKGMTNMKYMVNANFENHIIIKNDKILKFVNLGAKNKTLYLLIFGSFPKLKA